MKQLFNKIKPSPLHSDNKEMNKAIDDIRKALDQLYNLLDVSKEGRLTIDGDLKVKDLYVDGDSLYIGDVKLEAPKSAYDEYYLQYLKSDKKIEYVDTATATVHASDHEDGGADELDLTGLSGVPADVPSTEYSIAMSVALGMP